MGRDKSIKRKRIFLEVKEKGENAKIDSLKDCRNTSVYMKWKQYGNSVGMRMWKLNNVLVQGVPRNMTVGK